jgi:hypothetical protein
LLRHELPRQDVGDGSIEGYTDSFCGGDRLKTHRRISFGSTMSGSFNGLSSKASGLADLELLALCHGGVR